MTADHKLTPTERLHDLAMAAINRPGQYRAPLTASVKQGTVGPMAQVWHCDGLSVSQEEGETPLEAVSRMFDMAQEIQRRCIQLNADRLQDELRASVAKAKA